MKLLATTFAVIGALCLSTPVAAQDADMSPPAPRELQMSDSIREILDSYGFTGQFSYSDQTVIHSTQYGLMTDPPTSSDPALWPWASITKQVIAVIVLQQVEQDRLELDATASDYLPQLEGRDFTVRNLLQHQTDLPNPNRTERDANGVPAFYTAAYAPLEFCLTTQAERSEGNWSYNNCDYIVLGAILEIVTGQDIDTLIEENIAGPSGWENTRLLAADDHRDFVGADALYRQIHRFGPSAALVGPLEDLLRFDRALLDGELLSEESLATLWESDPQLGYMALGQWVFEAQLDGCEDPVRIVERRGGIVKYQARNLILPDEALSVVLLTDQGDFNFGEIWQGRGAMHDTLSAIVCN